MKPATPQTEPTPSTQPPKVVFGGSLFPRFHCFSLLVAILGGLNAASVSAAELEPKPDDAYFAKFEPAQAPAPAGLLLRRGDRLAFIGDSITEQKMYSRIIETYLTVCVPELKITAREVGWGGETAENFLRRMANDCLRFQPTVATLCYGMNDFRCQAYDEQNAQWYRANYSALAKSLKEHGVRVVLGSPGCVGQVPYWAVNNHVSVEDLNLCLGRFRNLDIGIAAQEKVNFADVFWPMLTAAFNAHQKYGTNYALCGSKDGVHPDWAGHLVMAYAFLKALGLDGDLGTFTVDLSAGTATATSGHTVDRFTNNVLTITSRRYPFCAAGPLDQDDSIRSGMTLVPFNAALNRLTLVVKGGAAQNYAVTWDDETHDYSAAQLAAGVNLADGFAVNPFSAAFAKVDVAVAAKQSFDQWQIQNMLHSAEGRADADATAALTEQARQPLVNAVFAALVPVTHTLLIKPK